MLIVLLLHTALNQFQLSYSKDLMCYFPFFANVTVQLMLLCAWLAPLLWQRFIKLGGSGFSPARIHRQLSVQWGSPALIVHQHSLRLAHSIALIWTFTYSPSVQGRLRCEYRVTVSFTVSAPAWMCRLMLYYKVDMYACWLFVGRTGSAVRHTILT